MNTRFREGPVRRAPGRARHSGVSCQAPYGKKLAAAILLLLAAAACSSPSSFTKKDADFTQYRTYGWTPRQFIQEVRDTVDEALSARGLVRTDDSPDLIFVDTFKGRNESKFGVAYGDDYLFERKALATVSLVAIDAVRADTVWAASAEANIHSPTVAGRKIADAVKKMMRSFPRKR